MATQIDDPELSLARDRVRSFEEKSTALRQGGGTLDANGEPKLTDSRGSKSNAGARSGPDLFKKARMNMMGGVDGKPMVSGPNLSVPGGDNAITGKVGGKARGRARMDNWDDVDVGSEQPREAMLRPTKLNIPTVRPRRIANADGATSFHFSHEAISKTNHEKTTAKGTKNRKGAAKDHAKYIERDGAVAKAHADDLDKIEKELQDIAKTDPELAERLGLAQEQDNAAKTAEALGVGALAGIYIEREEALAHDDNGSAVLFTNISEDPKERRDFWQEVEKREANPSEDRMRILLRGNEEFWKKVAEDEDCPKILKQSIEAGDADQEVVVRTGDNEEVRKLMSRYGWRPREKRPDDETDEQKAAREEREAETSFGARFEDGRGGRVQFRVVGELPYDVDPEARVRILKGFTEEFEKRNLPYIAVMHSPDHTNDDRNWHFHLVYHDRPVSRFTGKTEDHMWDLPDDAGSKKARQHEILTSTIGSPELEEHKGKWDFMVPWKYKKPVSRNIVTTYPFTQDKDREVTRRPFIPSLRKKLAELTNRELEAAHKDRRLDPRKYSEMGIHKRPDVHLGTQAARLESLGIPTEAGVINEENQWDYIRENLENKRIKTEREIERKLGDWKKSLAVADVTDGERDHAEREMIRWEQEARKASEHRAIALNLQEHYDRLQSRARKLEKMAEKHLKAINENRATQRQKNNASRYQEKLDEAKAHLLGLKLFMADEIGQIATSEASATTHETRAKKHEDTVDDIVAKGKSARKERENNSPAGNGKDATKTKAPVSGLSKGEVEGFIKRVLDRDARMVEENGLVVPRVKTSKDLEVIASEGYERTQKRLTRVKENHDKLVAGLLEALKKNPRMLVAQKAGDAERVDANPSERFRLASKDRRLQQAWRMFADEPDVIPAVDAALQTIRDQKRSKSVKNEDRDAGVSEKENTASTNRNSVATNRNETSSPKPATSEETKAPEARTRSEQVSAKLEPQADRQQDQNARKEIERVLDLTRAKFLRPAAVRMGDKLEITFSREDMALYKAPATLVIEDKRSVARMEGILGKHDRAVKRVVAYLAKNPSAIADKDTENDSPLAPTAPKELVKLAKNYARDPQIRRAVEDAVIRNRLDKFDPRKIKKEEAKVDAPVTEDATHGLAEGQNKDKPAETEQTKPAKAEEKAEKNEPAKEPEQASLFVRGPDGRLRRNVQPTEEREYGVRRISGEDAAAKSTSPKSKDNEQASEKRRGAILSDDAIGEGGGKTYERSNGRKLEKGINPKLDAWIEADEKRDRDAREKAAAIIREDRRLLSSLEEYDPQVRARLQRDWDGIEDRTRQRGRGVSDRDKNR